MVQNPNIDIGSETALYKKPNAWDAALTTSQHMLKGCELEFQTIECETNF